jgi:hypothetical protein
MTQGNNKNDKNDNSNRGLASADKETKERVARAGEEAPHDEEDYKQPTKKPVKE